MRELREHIRERQVRLTWYQKERRRQIRSDVIFALAAGLLAFFTIWGFLEICAKLATR